MSLIKDDHMIDTLAANRANDRSTYAFCRHFRVERDGRAELEVGQGARRPT